MPLPAFNANGDLAIGIHPATLQEVIERFGIGSVQRQEVTARLLRIYHLAQATGKVQRFVLFGSYITAKIAPNDVDVILVMQDDFNIVTCEGEARLLFDHQQADIALGASIFYTRPSLLMLETVDNFLSYWQIKRDQTQRGIVEIVEEDTDDMQ